MNEPDEGLPVLRPEVLPAGFERALRAGFATYASQRGASDRAIAHQTRHRSLASLDQYIRMESAWTDNAATALDL